MTKERLWHHGEDYVGERLDVATVSPDPFEQFRAWFQDAEEAGLAKVNAMTLATADAAGRPSARLVLLKELDARGFVFFTNYGSRKGEQLGANPWAALVFYWDRFDRQVRVEGKVERVADEDSDAYFAARPRGARIGAIASPQSRPLADRAELEARIAEVEREVGDDEPARPAWWGGFRVVPERIEFWQGQPSRLHDRVEYVRERGEWTPRRLAP
jgi:pyridoxamine 5'-phosphate oxidase